MYQNIFILLRANATAVQCYGIFRGGVIHPLSIYSRSFFLLITTLGS